MLERPRRQVRKRRRKIFGVTPEDGDLHDEKIRATNSVDLVRDTWRTGRGGKKVPSRCGGFKIALTFRININFREAKGLKPLEAARAF